MKQFNFASVVTRLRYRAQSGAICGTGSAIEAEYIKRCTTRYRATSLILTRDIGNYSAGWLDDPLHERCWHLSLACGDVTERDRWLRAFFGEHVEALWGQSAMTTFGQRGEVWHWRLFCDERWQPIDEIDADDLRAGGLLPAQELGIDLARAFAA